MITSDSFCTRYLISSVWICGFELCEFVTQYLRLRDSTIVCLLRCRVCLLLVHVPSLTFDPCLGQGHHALSLPNLVTPCLVLVGLSSLSCLVLIGTSTITYVVLTGRPVITYLWFLLLCHHLLFILVPSTTLKFEPRSVPSLTFQPY